jgi:hypothetical protein
MSKAVTFFNIYAINIWDNLILKKVLFLALPIFLHPFSYNLLGNISFIRYTGFNLYLIQLLSMTGHRGKLTFSILEDNIISTGQ